MKVSELIKQLEQLPQDAEIMKIHHDADPAFDWYESVSLVEYKEKGDYPNYETHIVIL